MKVIRQAQLFFQQGNSDKVYEVDLCETSTDEYVVNFRYGKRGAPLREGTKTVFPVPLAEAEKAYDKLVSEKTTKGYQPTGTSAGQPSSEATTDQSALKATVLGYLEKAAQGTYDEAHWSLSRVIWRAGEMRWPEAESFLLTIPRRNEVIFDYSLAWALGRCGSPAATEKLRELRAHPSPDVQRIAAEALSLVGTEEDRQVLIKETLAQLPDSVRRPIIAEQPEALAQQLSELLFELKVEENGFLSLLPRLSGAYPFVSGVLSELLSLIPFRPNYFNQVRYLLKAAELRDDTLLYGAIMANVDKKPEYFTVSSWGNYAYVNNEYIRDLQKEFSKKRPQVAYSQKTRKYLQRRADRWFRRLGEEDSSHYVTYARDVLLNFSDADAKGEEKRTEYTYEYVNGRWNSQYVDTHFPNYSVYPLLGFILYQNSPRYNVKGKDVRWRCQPPYLPGEPVPTAREEAFPERWDQAPELLVTLLQRSACQIVAEFATKAFRANPHRDDHTSPALITQLLNRPYAAVQQLGLDLAEAVYNPAKPDHELVLALLNCPLPAAQTLGMGWVDVNPSPFVTSQDFVIRLLQTEPEAVHIWLRQLLPQHPMHTTQEKAVVQSVVQGLLQLPKEEPSAYAAHIAESLSTVFAEALAAVDEATWQALLAHPLESLPLLAGKILIAQKQVQSIPDAVFETFIGSPHASVRSLGVELFGQLPDVVLIKRKDVLTSFCLSAHPEIRQQVQPIIGRLLNNHPTFGRELVTTLVPLLWRQEKYEGIHQDLGTLFRQQLTDYYSFITEAQVWKLVDADHREAHLLGAELLQKHTDWEQVPLARIVTLGSHELLMLRQLVRTYFQEHVSRIRYEREPALKLLDATWEDSRQFAVQFFTKQFRQEDWTPELLVSVCDRVRPEIQQFGLQQITQHFQEADGIEYMLKLSQHPNTTLQLFVTNYLTGYATDHPERLQEMEYYFTSVLSQVNRGSVTKTRVFAFLGKEAQKNETVAAWAVPLLTRISPTIAQRDRARCIQSLLELKAQYPHLDSPLTIIEPETV